MWQCTECSLVTKSTNLRNHIESRHVETSGHTCQQCGKFCKSKNALITHNHRFHSKTKNMDFFDSKNKNIDFFEQESIAINKFINTHTFLFLMHLFLDIDNEIRAKMINLGHGLWQCADCDLRTKSSNLYNHVESKHIPHPTGYTCTFCQRFCRTKHALITHLHRLHKQEKSLEISVFQS